MKSGKVYLVGGGPGDAELLTLKAARLLAAADVVVYDHLVGSGVLELTNAKAERIYVGKQSGNHTLPQDEINTLLVRLAQEGKTVVRLKGGDPFIFGRGGEEIEELVGSDIPFEVVPGVTSASGMAAYAGIPLTHRDHAQACVFVTGHLKEGKEGCIDLDWPALARPHQTVVIYMGVAALAEICRQLVAHGLPGTTPVAVVHRATQPEQKVVTGTLDDIGEHVAAAGLKPPSLIVVGSVVSLRDRVDWFGATQQ